MSLFIKPSLFIGLVFGSIAYAQGGREATSESQRSPTGLAARLKAEITRLDNAKLSPLFEALTDKDDSQKLRISADQANSARKLELITRDIIRFWLTRGLDADSPPAPTALVS